MSRVDKRVAAASARAEQERQESVLSGAVETIVEGTDKRVRVVSDYREALRLSAHQLLEYVEEIVAALPPALPVSHTHLATDPLVRRLIRSRDQIRELFRRNRLVQQFFSDPRYSTCEEVYGLLMLLRYEKTVLGSEMRGDMLIRGVRQTAVNFTARELVEPRSSEVEARNAVKQLLFESVVSHVKREIMRRREALSQEEKRYAILHPQENLNNPGVYLHLLTELLSSPRELLKMSNDELHINSMDIRLPEDAGTSSDTLELYEVGVGDEHSRVLSIVRYPRAEFEQG